MRGARCKYCIYDANFVNIFEVVIEKEKTVHRPRSSKKSVYTIS